MAKYTPLGLLGWPVGAGWVHWLGCIGWSALAGVHWLGLEVPASVEIWLPWE